MTRDFEAVDARQCDQEGNRDSCGRGESADWELAFDNAAESDSEGSAATERDRRAAEVVRPVAFLFWGRRRDVPLRAFVKLQRFHFDDAVAFGTVSDADSFIDGEAGDFSEVVVDVGANGTDSIWTKRNSRRIAAINFLKAFFTEHRTSPHL